MTRVFVVSILLIVLMLCSAISSLNKQTFKLNTVVIDAGHGGKDPGCSYGGHHEKTITLKIALKVGALIKEKFPDVKVIYTRSDDRFVELWERASIANRNQANLFISIHVNANPSTTIYGTETYAMGTHVNEKNLQARIQEQDVSSVVDRENEVILTEENYATHYDGFDPKDPASRIIFELFQGEFTEQSILFASKIEKQFADVYSRKSRGVKQAGFVVLYKTTMPAVLVETGYLTNYTERLYLASEEGQTNLATGIFTAFSDYKGELERK